MRKIIGKADPRVLARIKILKLDGFTSKKDLREKLLTEGHTGSVIETAFLAENLNEQSMYLAPAGAILGSVYLLKSYIFILIAPSIFYFIYAVGLCVFTYFLYQTYKDKWKHF